MDDAAGRRTHQRAVGQLGDLHTAVVLDLRHRGVDRCRQRHGVALVTSQRRTGQHQQVGAVAAQPCRQVVQPEQAVEARRVLFIALQQLDEGELLIDQRTAAPRHGLEHVVDQETQACLVAGQQESLGVQLVDRVGDLADLLGGIDRQRRGDRHGPAGLDEGNLLLKVGVGDLEGTIAQHAQRSDQCPPHEQRDKRSDGDGRRDQDGLEDVGGEPIAGPGLDRPGHRRRRVLDDFVDDVVGGLDRPQQFGVLDECHGRIGDDRHPDVHLLMQRLGVGRARTEQVAHPEEGRRFGTGRRDH